MSKWLILVLIVPVALANVAVGQDASINSTSQDAFATLAQADKGVATIGTSATQASITVAAADILLSDDILDIVSTDDSWQVHAEYRSHTGFAGVLDSITLRLNDGVGSETEIIVANGVATKTGGLPVDVPTVGQTELRALATATASGTLELDLVLTKDAGPGPTLRYPVTIIV